MRIMKQSTCSNCTAGHVPNGYGRTCAACEDAREFAVPGSANCQKCPVGMEPTEDKASCRSCPAGYKRSASESQCLACPAHAQPDGNQGFCVPCPRDQVSAKGEVCHACPSLHVLLYGSCRWWVVPAAVLVAVPLIIAGIYTLRVLNRKRLAERFVKSLESMEPSDVEAGIRNELVLILQLIGVREAARDQNIENIEVLALTKLKDSLQRCRGRQDWAAMHLISRELATTSWDDARVHAEHVLQSVKEWSTSLGIGLKYVLHDLSRDFETRKHAVEWRRADKGALVWDGFVQNCRWSQQDPIFEWTAAPVVQPPTNPTFSQMAPVLAFGDQAIGYGHTCPRDGMKHSSIVDALNGAGSNPASYFLSWAWSFDLEMVLSCLQRWAQNQAAANPLFDAGLVFIWWCFFVNDQFRILESYQNQSTKDLANIFGGQLRGIGKMLIMLGTGTDSLYLRRTWCIFECFVATSNDIPSTILLSESSNLLCEGKTEVDDLLAACRVDAKDSVASSPQDEQEIKRLILQEHGSFDPINQAVQLSLSTHLLKTRFWIREEGSS
eukprot:TRINITY_DN11971_c0_g1_i11.p1 TRINITY_DN11971_c0_g1~~TRINITY_DN11971_c0_g1_i11.p1  ORF type:complete len:553 (-),score=80.99 TRINITY_DN11971_c0_g1_i11:295-1953(-)